MEDTHHDKDPLDHEQNDWIDFGIHLVALQQRGATQEQARLAVIDGGADPERVDHYLAGCEQDPPSGNDQKLIESLYTVEERAAIDRWLVLCPISPNGNLEDANLVAEIALSTVKGELPQWAQCDEDGRILLGREHTLRLLKERDKLLKPIFLLMINWSDSAPGISWPETYYATLLPAYDFYVVTASQDSEDVYDYTDEAIGFLHCDDEQSIPAEAGKVIRQWWRFQHEQNNQTPWVYLFSDGEIDTAEAEALRDEVWHEEAADKEEKYEPSGEED